MSVAVSQAVPIARNLQMIAKCKVRSQLFPTRKINLVSEVRTQNSELRTQEKKLTSPRFEPISKCLVIFVVLYYFLSVFVLYALAKTND
ncbi:hypothetical protein SD81_003540 [Tolypothrix campylonemoides VB511288]|nr:hypothetical protein SD81_003540 [Tolypothrix campylonemoides VB511288]